MFETLPGFREFFPEAFAHRLFLFDTWRAVARRHGFVEYDGPVLEPLELYQEKSGEEIVRQLFHFTDKGGREVALRPEMTPTLARFVGAKFNSMRKPVKWFAIAENFRYEKPQKGRLRSHFQLNADIFGESGPAAEAELIALLAAVFRAFGLTDADFRIRLSDRELWLLFLEAAGIPESSRLPVLGVVDKMERTPEADTRDALVAVVGGDATRLHDQIRELCEVRDFSALEAFFQAHLSGDAHVALGARVGRLKELFGLLSHFGLDGWAQLDLGIVRGLAYYTGVVFEAFEASGEGRALAGGGRYDHLVEKLGGPAVPAIGFGLGDVTLGNLLAERGLLPDYREQLDVFVVGGGAGDERAAVLRLAAALRGEGRSADYSMKGAGFGKQFREANQRGARWVAVIGPDELEAGVVKLKNMETGEESAVAPQDVAGKIS